MTPTAKSKADALLDKLLKGKEIHDIFTANMKQHFLINGQTMSTWETKFKISVPTDNLTPQTCKLLDEKLLELNQEAAFFHAVASAKVQMLKRGGDSSPRNMSLSFTFF